MSVILKATVEKEIKKFIEKDNSQELSELVYELLEANWWEDQIYYYADTVNALIAFLLNPKVNKKFYKENPRHDIIVPQHLTRLAAFFNSFQKSRRAQAEIELENVRQKGEGMKEDDLQALLDKYSRKTGVD